MDMMNQPCLNCKEGWYEESLYKYDPVNTMRCGFCDHKVDRYYMKEETVCEIIAPKNFMNRTIDFSEISAKWQIPRENPYEKNDFENPNPNMNRLYLAGPFFNKAQIKLLEKIESLCDKYNVPYFSPRKDAGIDYDGTYKSAEKVFRADLKGLHSCGAVLACMDWKLSENNVITECRQEAYSDDLGGFKSPVPLANKDLNIPDPGTVWECGYTVGYNTAMKLFYERRHPDKYIAPNIPVFIYVTKPTEVMNIMIHIPASGVFTNFEQIEQFVEFWSKCNYPIEAVTQFQNYLWNGGTQ